VWLVRQTTTDKQDAVLHVEDRDFISNVLWNRLKLRAILLLVRRHWGVENDCFKSLDVQWQEDTKPWWTEGNAVQALGMLRLMAYNSTQMLRKRHLRVWLAGRWLPTPWRTIGRLLEAALIELARLAAQQKATAPP
jgi:predicted transposase YbfD/YdcC